MTTHEKIKNMTTEEFADWLTNITADPDSTPWIKWFNYNYCSKCEAIKCKYEGYRELLCSYCELYDKCKYFPDNNEVPDETFIVKKWLTKETK